MSIRKYQIEYEFIDIATVNIDHEIANPIIKEMVEFWMGWEDALNENDGDYTRTWLKNLALFIMRRGMLPDGDEGWAPLEGSMGISVVKWDRWEPDKEMIDIIEKP